MGAVPGLQLALQTFLLTVLVLCEPTRAQYSMNVHLSVDTVVEGTHVTVTCQVVSRLNSSFNVVWVKRTSEGKEFDITAGDRLTENFRKANRYHQSQTMTRAPEDKRFTLSINGAKVADSGEIGCRIASHRVEIFRRLTVLVPVQSVRMNSVAVDKTHAEAYTDGQHVFFTNGTRRRLFCHVNGSHPAPSVRVLLGDTDITDRFKKKEEIMHEGHAEALKGQYYSTELENDDFLIGFESYEKVLRCEARVPGSNFSTVNSSITIGFLPYSPRFSDCNGSLVHSKIRARNVRLHCKLQGVPVVTNKNISVSWERIDGKTVVLFPGKQNGHLYLNVITQPEKGEITKDVVLLIDEVYQPYFNSYTFHATNSEGSDSYVIHLEPDPSMGSLRGGVQPSTAVSACVLLSGLVVAIIAHDLSMHRT